ncbi:MAG TPA: ABC transporter substrate-binding protein [Candidatus Binatia bacterium]|jgi:NitT/TauT family transport system substrate-binding protein
MKTRIRGLRALIISLAVASALSAAGAVSYAADTVRLVLPHRVLFDISLPFYVAQEKGFYKQAGIEVNPIFAAGGGDQVQIMVAGDADVVTGTGLLATLSALERGAPIKIVSAEATGLNDVFWYVKGNSPIKKIEDLAGKKVSYSNPGSSSHLALLALVDWLKSKGVQPPELVAGGSPPQQFTGVMTDQFDAGWSAPPFFLEELSKGNIRILFRGNDVPGLSEITIRVNLARDEFVKKQPNAMRGFLSATRNAIQFVFANPDEAAKIWIKNAQLKEPFEVVKETWKFYSPKSMALAPIQGIDRSLEDGVKFKFLKKPFSREALNQAIDLSHLPK